MHLLASIGGILTALLKEIKHLIVIINHFFFTRIGFTLKVFVQVTMCFPCDFGLFFFFFSNFKLEKKKLNLVLNCNIYHLEKIFEAIMAENPVFLGLFRQTFCHPDSSGPSVV